MAEFALMGALWYVVIALALLFVFFAVLIFNGLISLRNNVDKSWANIDVVLKQRSDLIPNLVEAVKGYMKHERSILENITKLRAEMMSASGPSKKASANDALSSGLRSLFAVAENYPQLKASNNFLELQKQLSVMENLIADRREFYNDSVLLYNTRIASVPDSFFAAIFGMKPKEYFRATDDEKKTVNAAF